MTLIAVAWIALGVGVAIGFAMGRWAAEADASAEPLTRTAQ